MFSPTPNQVAAVLAVELCSLTLQQEDISIANIISSGLFGDGAAAVLVAGADRNAAGPEILATRSVLYPNSEHILGWDISEKGFKMVLAREASRDRAGAARTGRGRISGRSGLTRADVGSWVLHTGGPRVLEATAAALGLSEEDTGPIVGLSPPDGNLSSASVLVVLEEVMLKRRPAGTYGLLAAMGPGFSAELVLLRW